MLLQPAYAKLNLALEVVAKRPDGWHDLDSVLVRIDWHDLVGVTARAGDTGTRLSLSGTADGVPRDGSNLAARAAQALLERTSSDGNNQSLALDIWLHKRIPHAAGLGGGSADAAAVLRMGAHLLARRARTLDSSAVADAALEVGSDVPALLSGGAVRVQGRGERVQSITVPLLYVAVAMLAHSSTAATFAALTDVEVGNEGRVAHLMSMLEAGVIDESLLGSALEAAACRANPELERALASVRQASPDLHWHLTGSGGAVFAVTEDEEAARRAARSVREHGFVARPCRVLAAPAVGA